VDREVAGTRITAVVGDLTQQEVDAVVNAANAGLQHGGGVAAAIARVGGGEIQRASDRWVADHGPLTDGAAAVTTAGLLPATHVVHVAGPIHDTGRRDNAERLRLAVRAALDAGSAADARSIALPAISAGIYGYPRSEATREIAAAVVAWCGERPGELDEVRLVAIDEATRDAFAVGLEAALG
jgi:O-acetyl-ADP-ribose deacetylase